MSEAIRISGLIPSDRLFAVNDSINSKDSKLDQLHKIFQKWLALEDLESLDLILATVKAVELEGDQVWVFIIGAPSTGKTEEVRALSGYKQSLIKDVVLLAHRGFLWVDWQVLNCLKERKMS